MEERQPTGKATFIVQVQFCQNASWQGTVAWTEQKKEKRFRSTLELIKLMDEALNEREEELNQWSGVLYEGGRAVGGKRGNALASAEEEEI